MALRSCRLPVGPVVLAAIVGCATPRNTASTPHHDLPKSTTAPRPELRAELLKMMEADQELRNQLTGDNASNVLLVLRMNAADMQHAARMKEIVEQVGWPVKTMVGADGAFAAWLLVQHADLDPQFQERCLALMEQALREGEAEAKEVAYLTDRVRVNTGRPQVYGTQFHTVDGVLVPRPLEDPEHVDERRKHVGLGTMEEYTKTMRGG